MNTQKITSLVKPMSKSVLEETHRNLCLNDVDIPTIFMSIAEAEAIVRRGMRDFRERQSKFGLVGLKSKYKKESAKKNMNRMHVIEKLLSNSGYPWRLISNVNNETSAGNVKLRNHEAMYLALEADHNGFNVITLSPSVKEVYLVRRNIKISFHSMARIVQRRSQYEKMDLFQVLSEIVIALPPILSASLSLDLNQLKASKLGKVSDEKVYAPTPNGMFIMRYDAINNHAATVTWITDDQIGDNQELDCKNMINGFGDVVKSYAELTTPEHMRASNQLIH